MNRDVKVGVVGAGYWGRNLVRVHRELGTLAAVCDSDAEIRDSHAQAGGAVRITDRFEDLLEDPALDGVVIATPAATHGALVRAALEAGKHVFVEKPICLDVAEAESLAGQADAAGRVLMVGHLLLYHPAFQALQALVAQGRLGPLRYLYSNRLNLGKIRREENALWSFAPHDISMILSLAGRLPRRISCQGGNYLNAEVADTTLSHFDFGDGLQAHVHVSWLHPYKEQRLVVIGEEAMVVFDDTRKGAEKLLLYPHAVGWTGDVPLVDKAEAEPVPYDTAEPLKNECATFVAACAGEAVPPSDAREAIRVLTVLDRCQQAMDGGEPISLAAAS